MANSTNDMIISEVIDSRPPPGRLYFQVLPEFAKLKSLLLDGYVRSCIFNVPKEIVHICLQYYDEVQHWRIEAEELEPYYNLSAADKTDYTKNSLTGQIFYQNDIQMQCQLRPNKTDQDTVFYLNVFLPDEVEKIIIYSEVFCAQNDAHFRYVVPYITVSPNEWHYYHYVMYLNCKNFKYINLSFYFEILSIKYSNGQLSYFKPIKMKKRLTFKWNFDQKMIQKFRVAGTKQMFLSDTFDEYNNNWGLWIIPMDYNKLTDTKKVQIALTIYKRPQTVSSISVKYTLQTNHKNTKKEGTMTFLENTTFDYLEPLFDSDDLLNINTFSILLDMEVIGINAEKDFISKYSNVFE
eukprot:94096_1